MKPIWVTVILILGNILISFLFGSTISTKTVILNLVLGIFMFGFLTFIEKRKTYQKR